MNFERNFYKASAICPKCGTNEPKPKYYPSRILECFFSTLHCISFSEPKIEDFIIEDKVVNLCICGHEWEERNDKS